MMCHETYLTVMRYIVKDSIEEVCIYKIKAERYGGNLRLIHLPHR